MGSRMSVTPSCAITEPSVSSVWLNRTTSWGTTGACTVSAAHPHAAIPGLPEGYREQNPGDWIAAARAGVREVLTAPGTAPADVRAIGVAGQQALVPLDDADVVIRPAKLADDTSASRQRERL